MKFKVGDRVKVIKTTATIDKDQVGKTGKISSVSPDSTYPYFILGVGSAWCDSELQLVRGGVRMKKPKFFITYLLDEDPYKVAANKKEMRKVVADLLVLGATKIFVGEVGKYYEVTTPEKFELKEIK